MSTLAIIGTVALVHLLGVLSPGPDFLVVAKNSLTHSRKAGVYTALGVAAGIGVHILYSVLGLAWIISKSIFLFNLIKYLGAAYLIYLGFKALFSKSKMEIKVEKSQTTSKSVFFTGFMTNVLNPKVTLFFLGLFALVITPETSNFVMGVASLLMIVNTAIWFTIVALFLSHSKIQSAADKFYTAVSKTFGVLMISLGIKVALAER